MGDVGFSVSGRYLGKFLKWRDTYLDIHSYEDAVKLAMEDCRRDFDDELKIRKMLQGRFDLAYPEKNANKDKCDKFLMKLDIRPHPDLKINEFFKLLKSIFLKEDLFDLIKLVFEQRGDTDETLGNGFHCHSVVKCLIDNKDFKIRALNQIKTIIKKLKLDHILSLNCIEFKALKTNNYLNNHLKYTDVKTFNKSDVSKKSAWDNDARWRKSINLKDEYNCNADFIEDPFETPLTNFMKIQM